ncbi:MAG TPA: hypothetical protein DCX14_05960 [Flavobacteriales bacterium]|nr:hypothetical protein [Flavobacteriales bacterium]
MFKPYDIAPGSVNILIGPNGSGKSTLLRQWCEKLKVSSQTVLAMSPSIYDRFVGMRGWNFKYYGARQGRSAASKVIRDALLKAYNDDPKFLKAVTKSLKYVNFDGKIGIRIKIKSLRPEDIGVPPPEMKERRRAKYTDEMYYALSNWDKLSSHYEHAIVPFELDRFSVGELRQLSQVSILENEEQLKSLKLISKVEYFFFRHGKPIPLMEACSGELSFIAGLTFLAVNITEGAVIAIDEPENSLHPNWQKDYVEKLLDLLHNYQPKIVIATHSPIIISGAQLESAKGDFSAPIHVYQIDNKIAEPFAHEKLSLEEMYDELFGIITPKNHHLSQSAVELLNEMNAGKRSYESVVDELLSMKTKCYDEVQKGAIMKMMKLAEKLQSEDTQES